MRSSQRFGEGSSRVLLVAVLLLFALGYVSLLNQQGALRTEQAVLRAELERVKNSAPVAAPAPLTAPNEDRSAIQEVPPEPATKPVSAPSKANTVSSDCDVAVEQRMRADCWVKGARGNYTDERTARGGIGGGLSQSREDVNLYERYFYNVSGGTFLEMGALDGLMYSNTYYFEQVQGWRGLLIEGSPVLYKKLVPNRPLATALNAMVCEEERELHWIETSNAIGGIWEFMTDDFKKIKHPDITDSDVQALPAVPCVRLDNVLRRHGVLHVDLFSLDVEGAEESVLKSLDFDKFSASVVLVEYRPGQKGISELFKKAGYKRHDSMGPNQVFVHPRFEQTLN